MIRRALRSLRAAHAYVHVCVHQLRELTRGGAIGDSDMIADSRMIAVDSSASPDDEPTAHGIDWDDPDPGGWR
jgi:hypothetical protein